MDNFFQFESDFVDSLRCIPMQVRMKLDTCGVKLKLSHWNQFSQQERQVLIDMPCTTAEESQAYRQFLQQLVVAHTGTPAGELTVDPHPAWMDATGCATRGSGKSPGVWSHLTLEQWVALTPAQRFALIKLSRPSHENKNFLPALKEFQLI